MYIPDAMGQTNNLDRVFEQPPVKNFRFTRVKDFKSFPLWEAVGFEHNFAAAERACLNAVMLRIENYVNRKQDSLESTSRLRVVFPLTAGIALALQIAELIRTTFSSDIAERIISDFVLCSELDKEQNRYSQNLDGEILIVDELLDSTRQSAKIIRDARKTASELQVPEHISLFAPVAKAHSIALAEKLDVNVNIFMVGDPITLLADSEQKAEALWFLSGGNWDSGKDAFLGEDFGTQAQPLVSAMERVSRACLGARVEDMLEIAELPREYVVKLVENLPADINDISAKNYRLLRLFTLMRKFRGNYFAQLELAVWALNNEWPLIEAFFDIYFAKTWNEVKNINTFNPNKPASASAQQAAAGSD